MLEVCGDFIYRYTDRKTLIQMHRDMALPSLLLYLDFKEDLKEEYNRKKRAEQFDLLNTENEKEITCKIRSKRVWKRKIK